MFQLGQQSAFHSAAVAPPQYPDVRLAFRRFILLKCFTITPPETLWSIRSSTLQYIIVVVKEHDILFMPADILS
jgi:hypothetical protein